MKNTRINKIVSHASKLVRKLMKEWFGEEEKEQAYDKGRDTGDDCAASDQFGSFDLNK